MQHASWGPPNKSRSLSIPEEQFNEGSDGASPGFESDRNPIFDDLDNMDRELEEIRKQYHLPSSTASSRPSASYRSSFYPDYKASTSSAPSPAMPPFPHSSSHTRKPSTKPKSVARSPLRSTSVGNLSSSRPTAFVKSSARNSSSTSQPTQPPASSPGPSKVVEELAKRYNKLLKEYRMRETIMQQQGEAHAKALEHISHLQKENQQLRVQVQESQQLFNELTTEFKSLKQEWLKERGRQVIDKLSYSPTSKKKKRHAPQEPAQVFSWIDKLSDELVIIAPKYKAILQKIKVEYSRVIEERDTALDTEQQVLQRLIELQANVKEDNVGSQFLSLDTALYEDVHHK